MGKNRKEIANTIYCTDSPTYSSVEGRPIEVLIFGAGPNTILLMAGVHGDEKSGVRLVRQIIRKIKKRDPCSLTNRIVVMPLVNPDGYKVGTRRNARGIDINRNFPTSDFSGGEGAPGGTKPASEPETKAIIDVVSRFKPSLIITLHSSLNCINYNGDSAIEIANQMSEICGLEVKGDIGYPCPGSMGTYYGWERELPVITLELPPDGSDLKPIEQAILNVLEL
ncbi:MAG: M14 family zinc carboxypeptidase [Armatimonadota bacterium]|nr:M14 family zinc carboxypeptidase [Armatimonadota bacterium]